MIELKHVGTMSMTRRNRDFNMQRVFACNKLSDNGKFILISYSSFALTFKIDNSLIRNNTKGLIHTLSQLMYDSLLIMERKFRLHKAKGDFERLNAQRHEKRLKDKLALQHNMERSNEEHIDNMFLHERCVNGEC